MRQVSTSKSCFMSLVVCLAIPVSACAQNKFQLPEKSTVGDMVKVESELHLSHTIHGISPRAATPITLHTESLISQAYLQSVISKSADGKPDALRRTYTVYRETIERELNGRKTTTVETPLQGKTITIRRSGEKLTISDSGRKLSADLQQQLQSALDNTNLMPDHAVAIGDKWEVDPKVLARMTAYKNDRDMAMRYKLLEVITFGGHRCAHLRVNTHTVHPVMPGVEALSDSEGDIYLALDIERVLVANFRGTITYPKNKISDKSGGTTYTKTTLQWQKVAGKPVDTIKP